MEKGNDDEEEANRLVLVYIVNINIVLLLVFTILSTR